MKNILLVLGLFLLLAPVSMAQTTAGTILLGSDVNWQKSSDDNDKYFTDIVKSTNKRFSVQVRGGTFLKDNFVLGLSLGYEAELNDRLYENVNRNSFERNQVLNLGPFIRKYYPVTAKFFFYGQASTAFNVTRTYQQQTNYSSESVYKGATLNLRPGMAFFLTNKLSLDLGVEGISYSFQKLKNEKVTSHSIVTNINLPDLLFGLNFYLGR